MTITRTDVTRAAVRAMGTAYPSDVDAWDALDAETARALMTAVHAATVGESLDVRSHTALIVGGIYGRTDGHGVERTRRAVLTARRMARRAVTLAETHAGEMAAGIAADELEPIMRGAGLPHMPTSSAPAVDGIARMTYGDLVDAALDMAGSDVRDLVAAWETHAGERCDRCAGVGARVTLPGILAHIAGDAAPRGSAAHKRLTRQARAVLDGVRGHGITRTPRETTARAAWDALAHALDDPAPMATRPTKTHGAAMRTPVTRPAAPVVTYVGPDGHRVTRPMTDAERALVDAPSTGAPDYAEPVDGMPAMGTTPHAPMPGETRVKSHKPVAPRKAKRGGSTGPTVTGAPARLGMTR